MALFNVDEFMAEPSMAVFNQCRKADLLSIADHIGLTVSIKIMNKQKQ